MEPVAPPADTFPLELGKDQQLHDQTTIACAKLNKGGPVELVEVLEKTERTIDRVLSNDSISPSCLHFFLKKTLVDFTKILMHQSGLPSNTADRISKFFQSLLRLIVHYLEFLWIEHLEIISMLFAVNYPFYQSHGQDLDQFCPTFTEEDAHVFADKKEKTWLLSKYQYQVINYFCSISGFKKLIFGIKKPDLCLDTLIAVLKPFLQTKEFLLPSVLEEFIDQVQENLKETLLNMSTEQLKTFDKKKITYIIDMAKMLQKSEQSLEFTDRLTLSLALKFFQTPFLEKRILGLQDIKTYVQNVSINKEKPLPPDFTWVTKEFLTQWLCENNIIEKLYVNNVHVEILNRCKVIPQFLAEEKQLTPDNLTTIWNAGIDKHESILHVIYSSVALISDKLDYDLLQHLFGLITVIPYSSYDVHLFNLIRHFTIPAINANSSAPTRQYYGLDISWDLVQEGINISEEVRDLAFQFINDFLKWSECFPRREVFMQNCLKNLKEHSSICPSLQVLKIVIETHTSNVSAEGVCSVIRRLEEEGNLLELFFEDLKHYKCQVVSQSVSPSSKYSHGSQIKERLDFLEYIICASPIQLSREQLDMFWEYVIQNASTDEEQNLGFNWLANVSDTSKTFQPFTADLYVYLFETKFHSLAREELSNTGVNLILAYFERINVYHGRLIKQPRVVTVVSYQFVGIDLLWRIAFECKSDYCGNQVITYLTSHLKSGVPGIHHEIPTQGESYIKKCLSEIEEATSQGNVTENGIRILRALKVLRVLANEFPDSSNLRHGSTNTGTKLKIPISGLHNENFEVELHSKDRVSDLRAAIADHVDLDRSSIRIITVGKEIKDSDGTIEECGIKAGQKISFISRDPKSHVVIDNKNLFSPSALLSKPEYFHQLFDLLSIGGVIASQTWELLMTLPTNEEMMKQISEGHTNQSFEWKEIFDPDSIYKLLYTLQIVNSFTQNNTYESDMWCSWFVEQGGVSHLLDIIKSDVWLRSGGLTDKHITCLSLILCLVCKFCVKEHSESINSSTNIVVVFEGPSTLVPNNFVFCLIKIMFAVDEFDSDNLSDKTRAEIITSSFQILVAVCATVPDAGNALINIPKVEEWIAKLLVHSPNENIRDAALFGLYRLFGYLSSRELKFQLFSKLLCIFQCMETVCSTAEQFYRLLEMLVRRFHEQNKEVVASTEFSDFFSALASSLRSHPVVEITSQIQDPVLGGILTLLTTLNSFRDDIKQKTGLELMQEVFQKCLFEIPTFDSDPDHPPPKCKHKISRQVGYGLLLELATGNQATWEFAVQKLLTHHETCSVPLSWNYFPSTLVKSPCGFVGLQNLGATCYMNSLLQQLYMIPRFRCGILSLQHEPGSPHYPFVFQFKRLFGFLQESAKRYYETKQFCESYSDNFNPTIQMDADEFFAMLFDRLETVTKDTPQSTLLRDIFGGTVCNQVISKECEHVSERQEPFYSLSVTVKGKSSLEESLELYVEGDMLEGDNKYQCGKCDKKVTALKRCCIESLPNTLIVHMKRFEFDLEEMRRMKVNDHCKFPFDINIEPYTKEGLARREAEADNREAPTPPHADSYYQYELAGILVHTGTADSGHYYSFIKDRSNMDWFQFNDTFVDSFDRSDIPRQCFGGYEAKSPYDNGVRTRINNAYMLFYQRKELVETPTDIALRNVNASDIIQADIFQSIWSENQKFVKDTFVFDVDYFSFVKHILQQSNPGPFDGLENDIVPYNVEIDTSSSLFQRIQLGSQIVCNIISHAKERDSLGDFIDLLKSFFAKHLPACKWFLNSLLVEGWVAALLLDCTSEPTRIAIAELISSVIENLCFFEDSFYDCGPRPVPAVSTKLDLDINDCVPDLASDTELGCDVNEIVQKQGEGGKEFLFSLSENVSMDDSNVPLTTTYLEGDESESEEDSMILCSVDGITNDEEEPKEHKSHVIRFLDEYIRLIPSIAFHWRTFTQFFIPLKNFASRGQAEKQILLQWSVCSLIIRFFMQEEPNNANKNTISSSTDETPPSLPSKLLARVNITQMLELLSEIVCSCHTIGSINSEVSENLLSLNVEDMKSLYTPEFYVKAMRCKQDSKAILSIVSHLMREDQSFSQQLITTLVSKIYEFKREELIRCGEVLWEAIQLDDSLQIWRLDETLSTLLKVIYANDTKTPAVTPLLINRISDWCKKNDDVSHFIFNNINYWIFHWLVFADLELTRNSCEQLLVDLLPDSDELIDEELSPSIDIINDLQKRRDLVLELLLKFIPEAKKYSKNVTYVVASALDNSPWRLSGYFRLLKYLTQTPEHVELIMQQAEEIFYLFSAIDANSNELDHDKYEILSWWCTMVEINDSLIQFLTGRPTKEILDFIKCHVFLRPSEVCIEYNKNAFTAFYRIIYFCCRDNIHFLETTLHHPNFLWAIDFIYLPTHYTQVGDWLYSILKLAVEVKPVSESDYRIAVIGRILSNSDLHFSSRNALKLLNLLLIQDSDLNHFCTWQGPEAICQYPDLADGPSASKIEDKRALRGIEDGLSVLIKVTTFLLLDPDVNEALIVSWDNKLSLLSVIRKYLHFLQEPLLQQCFKLLFNLARLDNSFFESLIQCLYQEHENYNARNQPSKKLYALEKPSIKVPRDASGKGRHDGYYAFLVQICSCALENRTSNDVQLIDTVLRLIILGAIETLLNPGVCCLFVNLLQNVWDYQYYNQLLRSNEMLDLLIVNALQNYRLSDELFAFVKSVLPEIHERIPLESRKAIGNHAVRLLNVCLSATTESGPVRGLNDGIVDFVKLAILCSQDEIMKLECSGKANEMRQLFQYVTTQVELFKKISPGIEQLTVEYSLREVHQLSGTVPTDSATVPTPFASVPPSPVHVSPRASPPPSSSDDPDQHSSQ